METLRDLHGTLSRRIFPELVCRYILDLPECAAMLSRKTLAYLESRATIRGTTSWMREEFRQPADLTKQIATMRELFPGPRKPSANEPRYVRRYLERIARALGVRVDGSRLAMQFHVRDMPKKHRIGHRAYNKRWRLLKRMVAKLATWERQIELADLEQMAKVRMAHHVPWAAVRCAPVAVAFLAYLTAQMARRSVFTSGRQARAVDTVAEALWNDLPENSPWPAIAMVYPKALTRCSEQEKGWLLGMWHHHMERAAWVLMAMATEDGYDLERLVVQRGNDSSTWNAAAGAYNKCRDGWIGSMYAAGHQGLLEVYAPPKVLRLMAADVVSMHGGDLDPDTQVFNELPKAWDVLLAGTSCTREMIWAACARHRVAGKGWLRPREQNVATSKPTPNLLHGIQVESPELAKSLQRCGYFAGAKGTARALRAQASGTAPAIEKEQLEDGSVAAVPTVAVDA